MAQPSKGRPAAKAPASSAGTPRRTSRAPEAVERIRMRVLAGSVVAMGPGKADLLDAISAHGSISAAGRAMGMSYRRAWILVHTMNTSFRGPLVVAEKGGVEGGGARLTPLGMQVLTVYRSLSERVARDFAALLPAGER